MWVSVMSMFSVEFSMNELIFSLMVIIIVFFSSGSVLINRLIMVFFLVVVFVLGCCFSVY